MIMNMKIFIRSLQLSFLSINDKYGTQKNTISSSDDNLWSIVWFLFWSKNLKLVSYYRINKLLLKYFTLTSINNEAHKSIHRQYCHCKYGEVFHFTYHRWTVQIFLNYYILSRTNKLIMMIMIMIKIKIVKYYKILLSTQLILICMQYYVIYF